MWINGLVGDQSRAVHLEGVGGLVVGDQLGKGLESVPSAEVGLGFDFHSEVILKYCINYQYSTPIIQAKKKL